MARPSTMMRNQLKDSGQYNEKLKLAIDALDEQNICGPKGSVDFLSLLNELTIAANKLEKLSSFEFYDRPGKFLLFLKLDKTLFLDVRRRAIEELGKVNEHFLKETSDTLTALILSRVLDVKITNQDVYRCRTQIKVS